MSATQGLPQHHPTGKLILIGRKEYIGFPDWDLWRIRAKVDTGAYSSALGVADYELLETASGLRVRFRLPPPRHRRVIEAVVRLGPLERSIRLTVTDRSGMRCPMLLGRQALAGAFLVDVRVKYLLGSTR